ncbi:NAD(P)H-dependent oxidoreductase [Streptomyces sp. NPDC051561]|uniref:NAD(P)H-dependent oxidoreductase n=1 Tax=Streptomyces sp. NPDC051561 TaxID=3365658 RepID=UPI0037B3269D
MSLVCTLSPSPKPSSSQLLAEQVGAEFEKLGAEVETVRVADHDVRPGAELDMGDGDAWPARREKVMAADILLPATPIWLGHPDARFSLAPGAVTYWVGEAQQGTDYQDLDNTPEAVATTTHTLAVNAHHLAGQLRRTPYPPY